MAPHKLDNKIKKVFEKRTIEPSKESWETLNERLNQNSKKSSKRLFYILGFAATFIGVLLFVTLIFKTETSEVIVDTNEVSTEIKTVENNNENNKVDKEKLQQDEIVAPTESLHQNKIAKKPVVDNANTQLNSVKSNSAIIKEQRLETLQGNTMQNTVAVVGESNVIQEKQVAITNEGVIFSTQETDSLLAAAQQKIASQQQNDSPKILDYNGLLNEVEDDLEETLRDKMLKTVKSSYYTVKSVVAERNE